MKEIKVQITKYQTEDGKIFDNPIQAEHHEKMNNGTRKICEECHGTQQVPAVDYRSYHACGTCDGKGWVEKMEVWK